MKGFLRRLVERPVAKAMDFMLCAMMDRIQSRHLLNGDSRAAFQAYLDACAPLTPEQYFAAPPLEAEPEGEILRWATPFPSGFRENDRAHATLFLREPGAPTVFLLHALMSASLNGYGRWGARFNAAGWNACFVHLPYHYTRTPHGTRNGELAISPDMVRNGEGLRQGVAELRQLMAWFRARGTREFGLWATSYGGWIGALLLGLEAEFRFAVLMAPIVNVQHAIWQSGMGRHLRAELRRCGITEEMAARHEHLTFPARVRPLCSADRIVLGAGVWDQIVRAEDIAALHRQWTGSQMYLVRQGHFGFRMGNEAFRILMDREFVERVPDSVLSATQVKGSLTPFLKAGKVSADGHSRHRTTCPPAG